MTERLLSLDRQCLAHLDAPDMDADELACAAQRLRDDPDPDIPQYSRDVDVEDLSLMLHRQLPTAEVGHMLFLARRRMSAMEVVRTALRQACPDPDILIYRD